MTKKTEQELIAEAIDSDLQEKIGDSKLAKINRIIQKADKSIAKSDKAAEAAKAKGDKAGFEKNASKFGRHHDLQTVLMADRAAEEKAELEGIKAKHAALRYGGVSEAISDDKARAKKAWAPEQLAYKHGMKISPEELKQRVKRVDDIHQRSEKKYQELIAAHQTRTRDLPAHPGEWSEEQRSAYRESSGPAGKAHKTHWASQRVQSGLRKAAYERGLLKKDGWGHFSDFLDDETK
jgi:hypothetical protein